MTTYLTDSEGNSKQMPKDLNPNDSSQGKFIPATQRPDGTWRKARRVKEGYVPQEEVPLYESKGKQFAQRKTNLPVGMCPLVAAAAKKEREKSERAKNKKQTAGSSAPVAKTQQPAAGVLVLPKSSAINSSNSGSSNSATNKTANTKPAKTTNATTNASTVSNSNSTNADTIVTLTEDLAHVQLKEDDQDELSKKLKKLKKKIREIESIEAKMKAGELKKPEKDQLDKVKRKKEILKEVQQLEAAEQQQLLLNGRA